jgi:hypothetical protein
MKQNPNVTVNVLVLAKADKARTKIVLRSDFTATRLIESAQRWVEGGRNIPDIAYAQTKSPKLQLKPAIPHPAQVISLLKNVWPRDCSRSQKVKGVRIADGLGLLIERGAEERRTANLLLRFAIRHSFPLLSYIGHAQHRRDGKPKIDKNKVRQANSLFGLLGLLLFKLEYQKGDYMHGAPFLIGRLLALADTLHYEYCSHVREKSFPPQLIGNALIPAALDNPGSGLARLFERLRVYQAWAKTAQGENVGLAKWVIGQLGKTAEELSRLDLPGRCGDAAKAQMMLGYLAWMKYEKDDSDNAPKEGKQEEHHDA